MDKQRFHETLKQLHHELERLDSVDASERQALQQLMVEIQGLIESREDRRTARHDRLDERLREGVERLEASHPEVTALMGQAIDMLARMGI